jgi:cell division protein FtsB
MEQSVLNRSFLSFWLKRTLNLLGLYLILQSNAVFSACKVDATKTASTAPVQTIQRQQPVETSQDKANKEEMIKVLNAISQKVSEIEKKQQALTEEIYPAYKPPIQAELDRLNKELDNLQLRKTQLEAQKTVTDLTKH